MGPGCFHPRNSAIAAREVLEEVLQWGRDVSIPEIITGGSAIADSFMLQWGRDVSIPEIMTRITHVFYSVGLQWGRDVSIPEIL